MRASRALLTALQSAFWDVQGRRTSVARITSRGPGAGSMPVEPAAKLEPHDAPKLEPAVGPVTNTARAVAPEDVVATIDRVESVPKVERNDLRPRRSVTNTTNAARQSRWRSKQDAAALRLQAQVRMKNLRAKRKAGRNVDIPMLSS